jgi:hypothetical protein
VSATLVAVPPGGKSAELDPNPNSYTGKTQNQVSTDNSHIGHCTISVESTDVEVRDIQRGK